MGSAQADSPKQYQAFVGATLIDGTGRASRPDATVLIENEHISAVGNTSALTIPKNAKIFDVSGKWIVPGLIDAHVHFFQSGGLYTRPDVIDLRAVRPYEKEIAGIREQLPATLARYLASGVTSVVDMGGPNWTFEVRELARHSIQAPRVAVAGPLISTTLPAALKTDEPPIAQVKSPEEARAAVRRQSHRRPDLIKIWFIPAWGWPLSMQIDWVAAAIEESHAQGLRVAVHATELEVARAAVEAGADILAHSVRDRRVDDAFIQLLKKRTVSYVTTLAVTEGYRSVLQAGVELTEFERRLGDPDVLGTLDDLQALPPWRRWSQWLKRWPGPEYMYWNLKRLHAEGISIAAGSDAGNIGTLHGAGLHREL
ncbi:MAG: amidohydrolase family protein, partial [Gammaproteobacteria bacterium]